jgi:hypothetical protein
MSGLSVENQNSRTEALKSKLSAKAVRCSTALLGVTTLASRFASDDPKTIKNRVAREAITSSGASTQLAPPTLPKELQHCLPAEIGPLVTCRTFLPLPTAW